jgi:hypothetical protein
MSILSRISRLASDYRARRRRLATYLEISSLPHDIQKDIGWPDGMEERREPLRRQR